MRPKAQTDQLITYLWQHAMNHHGSVLKDVTQLGTSKFDFFLHSTPADPFSFSVFPLSTKGELLVDDLERLVASAASYFLFVNPEQHWLVAVRNTDANKKKLANGETPDSQLKLKLVEGGF